MEHAEALPCGQVGRGLKLILLGNRYKIVQLYVMKRMYTSRRSPLAYVIAVFLVIFVFAQLFVMVVGSKVSLIEQVLCGQVSHTNYSEEELPAHNIEMPIALAEQRSDVTTNASPVQMESLEKHTHEGLSIESEMDETDNEIEPVG